MKRIVALLLAAAIGVALLAGCPKKQAKEEDFGPKTEDAKAKMKQMMKEKMNQGVQQQK